MRYSVLALKGSWCWDLRVFLDAMEPRGELCSLVHPVRLEEKGWKLDVRIAFGVRLFKWSQWLELA